MEPGPSCQLHRPLNHAYRSLGPTRKCHCAGHHLWPALYTALPPPPATAVIVDRLICACGLRGEVPPALSSPLSPVSSGAPLATALPRRVPPPSPPSASMWTGHSIHPSAPSPPPRAPQPLRGPHRPPRRLPRPVVYLYPRRSPRPTHATADGLTGEHPSSPLPQMGPLSHCVALAVVPDTPSSRIAGNRPAPPPVAMESPPLPLFDHGPPAHGWPASLVGLDGLSPD
jgi:hypothetical protein